MSTTQYAWGEEETAGIPHVDVKLTTDEYEELIQQTQEKCKEYSDDETSRFYSKLLGKLLILANQWTLFYVIGSHMNNLPVNFLSELMNLPSNKLNTLTQSASNLKSNVINESMNVYDSRLYSEVLKYYSERNEFFPS